MKFYFGLVQALTIFGSLSVTTALTPILIVPGLTGSQLSGTVKWGICDGLPDDVLLWIGPKTRICPTALELQYDQSTNTYSDMQGVSVSVPGFGNTSSVECLSNIDDYCKDSPGLQYFKDFVDYFVNIGYKRGSTIRAAPYDWRRAANSLKARGYFDELKSLIEVMYKQNGNTPVALVAHSMGAPVTLYFLNEVVEPQWKTTYIKVYIPLSGAFGGASLAVQALVSGYTPKACNDLVRRINCDDIPFLEIERSLESVYWLMPRDEIFRDQVLVQAPDTSYTASDYQKLFTTFAKYPLGWTKYNATSTINAGYPFPGVPTHCLYGSEVDTPLTFVYGSDRPPKQVHVVYGYGDDTVNKASLEVCLRWKGDEGFKSLDFPGVTHINMVKEKKVLDEIAKIVTDGPPSGPVIPRFRI